MLFFLCNEVKKNGVKMVGIYFSGTGNSKYCVERFLEYYDGDAKTFSIEDKQAVVSIKEQSDIVFGYPVYYSNLPKILREFIETNKELFAGKNIYIIATMGLFSGDGAGYLARLLKKHNAHIIGGLHVKMPDCIGDVKILKKPLQKDKSIVQSATEKIKKSAIALKNGKPSKNGLSIFARLVGFLGQRLWFYNETKHYSNKLKIDSKNCIVCGACIKLCPMNNFCLENSKLITKGKCTKCYRCIANCPKQAITLLGKKVLQQSKIENYL